MSGTWGVAWGVPCWGVAWSFRPLLPPLGIVLMINQSVPNNAPDSPPLVQVSAPGAPTRARFTFSLSGPSAFPAEATVYAAVPGVYNPGVEIMYDPILVMVIAPGEPHMITQELALGAPYNSYAAVLNMIEPGHRVSATLIMAV